MGNVAVAGLATLGLFGVALVGGLLLLLHQSRRHPSGDPQYVAMGSSFAAGIGLGRHAPATPLACMRTLDGYPQQLARLLELSIVDVTCSAATTRHILEGGQYFQRPQLDALGPDTKLVTITSGGNDVGYVGDLSLMAARNERSFTGWFLRRFCRNPALTRWRDFDSVCLGLVAVVAQVRQRSPKARVVLVTYPAILPLTGTCPRLAISQQDAAAMRDVGERLADATRSAARESGALLVDMQQIGAGHHACTAAPWVNGWSNAQGTRFHPTLTGARAVAAAIAERLAHT